MSKRHLLAAIAAIALPSCGGGGSPAAPTPPTTQAPTPAIITVTQNGTAQLCNSPFKRIRVAIPITIAESGGTGFNANFADMTLYRNGDVLVEGAQIGASDITAGLGSNHFAARSSTNIRVHFDFNARGDSFDYARETFDFTDDQGHRVQALLPGINPIIAVANCTI